MKFRQPLSLWIRRIVPDAGRDQRWRGLYAVALLLLVNITLSRKLWVARFTNQLGSVEGSFISISRYALHHWGDLKWFPLWFCGMPFLQVYQPGFHLAVAAIAGFFHITPERSYHIFAAALYCLGPVSFYALCYRATGRRDSALFAGLIYSLFSPAALVSSVIRADLGGLWLGRRYQTLVHYGEGPHIAVLTLLPLVILSLDHVSFPSGRNTSERRLWALALIGLLAVVALTNWPGSIGVSFAIAAYALSCIGTPKYGAFWLRILGCSTIAFLIACPFMPLSVITAVPVNAQRSDGTYLNFNDGCWIVAIIFALCGLHYLFDKLRLTRWPRFFLYFSFLTGVVVLSFYWGNLKLLPQPHRWQLEMEMAFIGTSVCVAPGMLTRLWFVRGTKQSALIGTRGALVVMCAIQFINYWDYGRLQTLPIDIKTTVEYQMAKWFDQNMAGERVFAPGSVSVWMNMFTDVPQMVGCCDQSVPSFEHRVAFYSIYAGDSVTDPNARNSLLWLKAYGVRAIGVSGAHGREFFKPFAQPDKFAGILPEVWRSGKDVVYRVPSRSTSLARVIPEAAVVSRSPYNGVDTSPLVPFVAALEDSRLPVARITWRNSHSAQIVAELGSGQVISLQNSYAPGWHAAVNGKTARVSEDGIGLTIIRPECIGTCVIELSYDAGREALYAQVGQVLGLCLMVLIACWPIVKRDIRGAGNPVRSRLSAG
jgi:hypothetical protein